MMTRAAAVAALAFVIATPAVAGVPAILKATPAADATATTAATSQFPSSQGNTAPQAVPKGVPGYYDPATKTFTPLETAQPTASKYTGAEDFVIQLVLSGHLNSAAVAAYVLLDRNFGHVQSSSGTQTSPSSAATTSSFFVDQYTRASTVFSTSKSSSTQTASTSFVTGSPLVQTRVTCNYSENLITHSTSILVAQGAPKSRTTKVSVTCNL